MIDSIMSGRKIERILRSIKLATGERDKNKVWVCDLWQHFNTYSTYGIF